MLYDTAIKYYKQCAFKGDAYAREQLIRRKEIKDTPYNDSIKSLRREREKNWKLEDYVKAAKNGDTDAQFVLGQNYLRGWGGVEKNYTEAAKWLKLAAEKGVAEAQSELAMCYGYDPEIGDLKDKTLHYSWLKKAAENGDMMAQWNLGSSYLSGESIEKDIKKGIMWLTKSADQDNYIAELDLGKCYQDGKGVKKDKHESLKFYIRNISHADLGILSSTAIERIFTMLE